MRVRIIGAVLAAVLAIAGGSCGSEGIESSLNSDDFAPSVDRYQVEIEARYPHDPEAFTQGLVFDSEGNLFESTGIIGESSLREVDLNSGEYLRLRAIPDVFAEGLAVVGDELWQLTWTERTVYRWDIATFEERGSFTLPGEGWGITSLADDSNEVAVSDGSATIRFYDTDGFTETRSIDVVVDGTPLGAINELEFVDGLILANIWKRSEIAMVDPESGEVLGIIDATPLVEENQNGSDDVLNGIAHRRGDSPDRLFLTGKRWDTLYEVTIDNNE